MTVKIKDVFTISERTDGDSSQWLKIGVAFENKDGSHNVILEANPVNGKLHIRDRAPTKEYHTGTK